MAHPVVPLRFIEFLLVFRFFLAILHHFHNLRPCKTGDENGCDKMATFTFGGECGNHGRMATDSGHTQGGYSKRMTVHRHFAIKVRTVLTVDIR